MTVSYQKCLSAVTMFLIYIGIIGLVSIGTTMVMNLIVGDPILTDLWWCVGLGVLGAGIYWIIVSLILDRPLRRTKGA